MENLYCARFKAATSMSPGKPPTSNMTRPGLTTLPEGIGNLKKLQTLNINSNSLGNLPASFSGLTELHTLIYRNNGIVTYLLKEWFQHERPFLYLERTGWEGPLGVLDYQVLSGHASFPSGHSMAAWALFTMTAALIRKPWVSFVCLFLVYLRSFAMIMVIKI